MIESLVEIVKIKRKVVVYMPRLDGTGPLGKGPMTGLKKGNCQTNGKGLGTNVPRRRPFSKVKGQVGRRINRRSQSR